MGQKEEGDDANLQSDLPPLPDEKSGKAYAKGRNVGEPDDGTEGGRQDAAEAETPAEPAVKCRVSANISEEEAPSSSRIPKSTAKKWKKAAKVVREKSIAKNAVAKVNAKNKIGTKAEDLEGDGNVLKVLGLAVQRAFRDFGKARAARERGGEGEESGPAGVGMEGTPRTLDELEFSAEEEDEPSTYNVRQPAFVCCRVEDEEFSKVRAAFDITDRQYYAVLGLQEGRNESDLYVIGSNDASGKSSSFFFLSPDQRCILKSCTSTDVKTVMAFLKRYREYVESQRFTAENGKGLKPSSTLLPRCFGLYSFDFDDPTMPPVVMVAMTNFFGGTYEIDVKYDLKGSTHGRLASDMERSKKSPVLKDLNWMEEGRKLRFPARKEMERVQSQLERDTAFLSAEGLIDYSLLVGLHEMDESEAEAWRYDHSAEAVRVFKARSETDQTIAYYGIVDVLTPYGLRKRGETFLTGTLMCGRDVSCQPPPTYRHRFLEFCKSEILAYDEDDQEEKESEHSA
mmetsp:Transcript_4093/g.11258  ORF Transcript_4093/g.11258 Transcript_4093/m.11258 type:complete len:512 (-) Transcript_4093:424-1959(-)